MVTKTTVKALIAGGGVLATWFAVGPNDAARPVTVAPAAQRAAATRETTAEELNAEAAKLREHVSSGQLRPSTRNPFRFGATRSTARHAGGSSTSAAATTEPAAPSASRPPAYTLAGVAERNTTEGLRRTAVISGEGQLWLVTEGEVVGGRYTVVRIDPEAVLLRDQTGAELSLIFH